MVVFTSVGVPEDLSYVPKFRAGGPPMILQFTAYAELAIATRAHRIIAMDIFLMTSLSHRVSF
jgi:hypothetical protein